MTEIAFTIGFTASYDESIRTGVDDKKMGQREDYEGGWVWKTPCQALSWLYRPEGLTIDGQKRDPNEFSIYSLALPRGWAEDVSEKPGPDGAHLLLHDAKLVAKVLPSVGEFIDHLTEIACDPDVHLGEEDE